MRLGPLLAKGFRDPLRKVFFSSFIGKVPAERLRITFGVISHAVFEALRENGFDKEDVIVLELDVEFKEEPEIKIVVWKYEPTKVVTRTVDFEEELEELRRYREAEKSGVQGGGEETSS